MPSGYYKDIVKILKSHGWIYLNNAKGSHERWIDPNGDGKVFVPRAKSRHTANEILKQAGLKERL